MDIIKTRKKINTVLADYKLAKRNVKDEKQHLAAAEYHLICIKEAQEIVQQVAQTIQEQAHSRIAGVVSKCLQTVFDGEDIYAFKIHFERKRSRTEAKLVLVKNGHEIADPLNSDSGGIVDVAALALRLACLVLSKPTLRRIILLDEPFKFVSWEFLDNVRMLLEGLAKDFDVQFLMVTHIMGLKSGKVVEL